MGGPCHSAEPAGVPARSPASVPAPARTTAYGSDPAQVYDVRLPTTDPTGITVVVVHGGFWRAQWDRAHAAAQAQAFADAGHHVAVVEYRRTGMPGGGWPGTFADVAAAVAAIRADPALPDRCVLVGHSAGGHLVALAAGQPWAHGLAGAVSLGGCVDLALCASLDLGSGAARAFLGTGERAATTPAASASGAWLDADPALHPPAVPVVLLHGELDDTVPLEVSRSYAERMAQPRAGADSRHAPVRLHGIPGVGHDELIDPAHPAFAATLRAVSWLARR